jgi:hypothetical protein
MTASPWMERRANIVLISFTRVKRQHGLKKAGTPRSGPGGIAETAATAGRELTIGQLQNSSSRSGVVRARRGS